MKNKNILFLTLKVFSDTGGIEKVCKVIGKAFFEYGIEKNEGVQVFAMHGNKNAVDGNRYFPSEMFKCFEGRKIKYSLASVIKGYGSRVVVMSHINLLVIGWLIKKISASTKLILFAHGIEIWKPLGRYKRLMLQSCDEIIAVSQYTAGRVQELQQVNPAKIRVINNCLDPFLPLPGNEPNRLNLRQRYGFSETNKIIFTLTRICANERYKGYDNVMRALVYLKKEDISIRYLLSGSYDPEEKQRIDTIIDELGLKEIVVMTGFIPDEELAAHFSMADIYVMPSSGEGFGIVFIEAMYYGLPVIAGNTDGSTDALLGGRLGLLVDPDNIPEIKNALEKILADKKTFKPDRELLMENFSYETYKRKLDAVLVNEV